jgi:hypothetical protein
MSIGIGITTETETAERTILAMGQSIDASPFGNVIAALHLLFLTTRGERRWSCDGWGRCQVWWCTAHRRACS